MTNISTDDVKYVAALAKIAITDDDAKRFTKELSTILDYVQQLDAVDTTGLQPTYQVTGLANVTRKDVIVDYGTTQKDLLKNVPRTRPGGYIEVPKVL
jgi:aspartyl-tRNA(Asn)/glutamyl-tRNA(Gln) amidotransferase subunit C